MNIPVISPWLYKRRHKKFLDELDKVLEQAEVPKKDVIVAGSAPMGAEGLRKIDDLDVAPTPSAFKKLVKAYNLPVKVVRKGTPDETCIAKIKTPKVLIELAPQPWVTGGKDIFGKSKIQYGGFKHWGLEDVRRYKSVVGREKDIKDIKMIDKHLAKQSSFAAGFLEELAKIAGPNTGKIYEKMEFPDDGSVVHFPPNDKPTPTTDHRRKVITDASVLGHMRSSAFDA